ncbi:unnamed protein product [Spirodela intermedia]|uniref:Uncharacterized protein n=1 Tax=Spirodela intermedia TaxID=51605 RepID=A0ABN7ECT1_SPIIN|nr:unnamed protein product [Spirodela intermedia]
MSRRIIFGGCHPMKLKNSDFVALQRLSPDGEDCHPMEKSWMEVGRWRLVSRRIVLFPTTACSSINRR